MVLVRFSLVSKFLVHLQHAEAVKDCSMIIAIARENSPMQVWKNYSRSTRRSWLYYCFIYYKAASSFIRLNNSRVSCHSNAECVVRVAVATGSDVVISVFPPSQAVLITFSYFFSFRFSLSFSF